MQKSNFPGSHETDPSEAPNFGSIAIGERLRAWRRSMRLTQNDLATQLDVNKATLRRYELGLNALTTSHLTLLYSHGVNMNWLLTGEGGMLRADSPTPLRSALRRRKSMSSPKPCANCARKLQRSLTSSQRALCCVVGRPFTWPS
ncbi:helix-turn-helix domain-containing protein [Delftia tsuruhatensis]